MIENFKFIIENYENAKNKTPFRGPHDIQNNFKKLQSEIENLSIIKDDENLIVKYSYGKGNWAHTPWLAILDKRETTTTQKGTYIVILFHSEIKKFSLKLAQGVTEVRQNFGRNAAAELQRRSKKIQNLLVGKYPDKFKTETETMPRANNVLADLYQKSSILSRVFSVTVDESKSNVISNENNFDDLERDIQGLVKCYLHYVEMKSLGNRDTIRRSWCIAAGENNIYWEDFVNDKVISIGWKIGDLNNFVTKEEIKAELIKQYPENQNPSNNVLACYEFGHVISISDYVYVKKGSKKIIAVGKVTSDYFYDQNREQSHIRNVEWLKVADFEFEGSITLKTLTDFTKYPEFLRLLEQFYFGNEIQIEDEIVEALMPKYTIDDFVNDTGFSKSEIQSWERRLKTKKQIVFQGPPGTGKTFVADKLCKLLVSQTNGHYELVQFHPSYNYEDFMQGLRPKIVEGELTYELEDGRFLDFCNKASESSHPFIIIIDEMNRANLSRVFGELMYLFEYREEEISLSSGGQRFSIPNNVYIIGTMNTADRSIALVDHALRRRFSFFRLNTDYQVLKKRLLEDGLSDTLVEALRKVNNEIGDQNYFVGISFFMKGGSDLKTNLVDIWKYEIEPYLEEYFYDEPSKFKELTWEKLSTTILNDW